MEIVNQMLDHHLEVTDRILERSSGVSAEVLDQPLLNVEGIDRPATLRATNERLVSQLEMWIAALEGASATPSRSLRVLSGYDADWPPRARASVSSFSSRSSRGGPTRRSSTPPARLPRRSRTAASSLMS